MLVTESGRAVLIFLLLVAIAGQPLRLGSPEIRAVRIPLSIYRGIETRSSGLSPTLHAPRSLSLA